MASNLTVDGDRLWHTIEASSAIGRGPNGGLRRLTLTDDDKQMRDLLARWADEAGFALRIDQLGNMFLRREGQEPGLPPVLIGSHLDTQAAGGRFDGILGVLGGLEVLRTLNDTGIATRRPIEVVNWTNEEGARFTRRCSPPWCLPARKACAGPKTGRTKRASGLATNWPVSATAVTRRSAIVPIDAYFELHIEQGPRLDAAGIPVGIVTGGFPTRGMRIDIVGETAHVGPTAMERRRNALVGASHVAVAIDEIGWRYSPAKARRRRRASIFGPICRASSASARACSATCGTPMPPCWSTWLRTSTPRCRIARAAAAARIEIAERWGFGGLKFDPGLITLLREAAADLGHATMDLQSEAGHDAYNMASVCPTAMIFTPCKDGISHNEKEDMTLAQALPATNVLLRAVLARAGR